MKQHPDRKPRRAVTVRSGQDDPGNGDTYFFDGEWIDDLSPALCTLSTV